MATLVWLGGGGLLELYRWYTGIERNVIGGFVTGVLNSTVEFKLQKILR